MSCTLQKRMWYLAIFILVFSIRFLKELLDQCDMTLYLRWFSIYKLIEIVLGPCYFYNFGNYLLTTFFEFFVKLL